MILRLLMWVILAAVFYGFGFIDFGHLGVLNSCAFLRSVLVYKFEAFSLHALPLMQLFTSHAAGILETLICPQLFSASCLQSLRVI